MRKNYNAPSLEEVGGVAAITAAFGTSTRSDFNEFANTRGDGSFDICDPNRMDSDPDSNCSQPPM